jgi:hypothetical protein
MIGLTPKGRAYAALLAVRDRWDSLSDDQRAEVADLVAQLAAALRRERASNFDTPRPVRVPLVGRICA